MPDFSTQMNGLIEWASGNALQLALVAALLLISYRFLGPWIHRLLVGIMKAQPRSDGSLPEQDEVDKRVATVEDLLTKLLRTLFLLAIIAVILGIFDLWSVVTGLGLVLAALTLAGQSIILDYLMGILILVEGQYFKGDTIQVGGVEGVVEEVGIRRTVIRDVRGTVHSISNGTIRQSANLTRTYAQAVMEIDGVADRDVESVIDVLNQVGTAMAADTEFEGVFHAPPAYAGTTRLSSSGATLRLSARVRPDMRARVEQEMRRRVAAALAATGIELIRPAAYGPPPR